MQNANIKMQNDSAKLEIQSKILHFELSF